MSETPYPEQPPSQPSGYGQQPAPYGPSGYGQLPGAPNPYGGITQPSEPNVSAIVLTCLTAVLTVGSSFCCLPVTVAPLIFGILGIVKQSTDREGAARMTRIGWIILAVLTVLTILAVIGFFTFLANVDSGSDY